MTRLGRQFFHLSHTFIGTEIRKTVKTPSLECVFSVFATPGKLFHGTFGDIFAARPVHMANERPISVSMIAQEQEQPIGTPIEIM